VEEGVDMGLAAIREGERESSCGQRKVQSRK
jgi:hypothetical protein